MNKTPLSFPDFREPVEPDKPPVVSPVTQFSPEQIRNLEANHERKNG